MGILESINAIKSYIRSNNPPTNDISGDLLQQQLVKMHMATMLEFTADAGLSSADVGYLVMNEGNVAKKTARGSGLPGSTGAWSFLCEALAKPKQAGYELTVANQQVAGTTFKFIDRVFTFVSAVPAAPNEIQIGATVQDTVDNITSAFNAYAPQAVMTASSAPGKVICDAGHDYPGAAGNAVSFDPQTTDITYVRVIDGIDNALQYINNPVLRFDYESSDVYIIYLSDICSLSTPNGIQIGAYRWPETPVEVSENLVSAINNHSYISSLFQAEAVSSSDYTIIDLFEPTIAPTIVSNVFDPYPFFSAIANTTPSYPPIPGYVKSVVLGKLEYVEASKAYITQYRIQRLKLAPGISVEFDTNNPSDILPRMLFAGDGGMLYPPAVLTDDALFNGFYLALEEKSADSVPQDIYVERVFIPS